MSNYHWGNPVRTGAGDASTLAERTHVPDPAAVARLKALMEEERQRREAEQTERVAQRKDTAARIMAASKRHKTPPDAAAEPVAPEPVPAGPATTARPVEPRYKLDDDAIRALHARHLAGEAVMNLAVEAEVGRATLTKGFQRLGLRIARPAGRPSGSRSRSPMRVFTAGELAAAVAAHDAGRRWRDIAAELKTARVTLRHALIAAGYATDRKPNRPPGGGPPPKLGNDLTHALHARYMAGERPADLAVEAGVSLETLRRSFRRLRLPAGTPRHFELDEAGLAFVTRERGAGRSWREIAADLGVSRRTLQQAVGRAGEDAGLPAGRVVAPIRRLTEEEIGAAVAAHRTGQSWADIAAGMGIGEKMLRTRIGRAGHDTGSVVRRGGHGDRYDMSEADVMAVMAARAAGRSWGDIAGGLGIDRTTLRHALKRAGVEDVTRAVAAHPSRFSAEQLQALHDRRLAGERLIDLAAEVGAKTGTLTAAFERAGFPYVCLRSGRPIRQLTEDDLAAAVAAHNEGRTWMDCAAMLGISHPTLHRALQAAGYDTGRRKEPVA